MKIKRILLAIIAMFLISVSSALAAWDVTGTWEFDFVLGTGHYVHTMDVTSFNCATGDFSGTGVYNPDNSYTWDVTGTVNGDGVDFKIVYTGTNPGYTVDGIGIIASDGLSMSGTATGPGQLFTFTATGTALVEDCDGVPDSEDRCPETVADDPTKGLGTNRWIWNGGAWETELPKGEGPQKSFTMDDTQGCSCSQILDDMGDGKKTGHRKFGCSISVMEDFIAGIQPIFVDTVEVPSDGSTVSSVSLDDGVEYLFEASGTYTYWPAQLPDAGIADAHCSLRPQGSFNSGPGPQWINGDLLTPGWENYLEVWVDNNPASWSEDCNDDHVYTLIHTGTGSAVEFKMLDSGYGDNSGFITVDIYELP